MCAYKWNDLEFGKRVFDILKTRNTISSVPLENFNHLLSLSLDNDDLSFTKKLWKIGLNSLHEFDLKFYSIGLKVFGRLCDLDGISIVEKSFETNYRLVLRQFSKYYKGSSTDHTDRGESCRKQLSDIFLNQRLMAICDIIVNNSSLTSSKVIDKSSTSKVDLLLQDELASKVDYTSLTMQTYEKLMQTFIIKNKLSMLHYIYSQLKLHKQIPSQIYQTMILNTPTLTEAKLIYQEAKEAQARGLSIRTKMAMLRRMSWEKGTRDDMREILEEMRLDCGGDSRMGLLYLKDQLVLEGDDKGVELIEIKLESLKSK